MLWLEMSRDENHGGGNWAFGKCVWSPTRKTNDTRWSFWETVKNIKEGDIILHLRGAEDAAFVGYSIASTDGYETASRPPDPGIWSHALSFYRADLIQFTPFPSPVHLRDIFSTQDSELRTYFLQNKKRPAKERERLFYVIQAGRLQCLNGAYLSEISAELLEILFHTSIVYKIHSKPLSVLKEVDTNEVIRQLKTRVGQKRFSDNICENYNNQCCFPDCEVNERSFLIGAHIARWSDNVAQRGKIDNGLCFCLMHDKAFEKGLFTLDFDFRIWSEEERLKQSNWGINYIHPKVGRKIRLGKIQPSHESLLEHWERVSLYPNGEYLGHLSNTINEN